MRVFFHQHLRKRIAKFANYPHPKFWMRVLDRIVLITGIVSPVMTIPQIVKIYAAQDAAGVSVLSWTAFALFDLPFIFYGIVHGERPIVVTYVLWFVMNSVVLIGALLYG